MKKKKFFSVWSPEPLYDARRPLWGRFLAWGLVFALLWGSFVSGGFTGLSRAFANGGPVAGQAGVLTHNGVYATPGGLFHTMPVFRIGLQRNKNYLFKTEKDKKNLSNFFKNNVPYNGDSSLYFIPTEVYQDYHQYPAIVGIGYTQNSIEGTPSYKVKTGKESFSRVFFNSSVYNPFSKYNSNTNQVEITDKREFGYFGVLKTNYSIKNEADGTKAPISSLSLKGKNGLYNWEYFTPDYAGDPNNIPLGMKVPVSKLSKEKLQQTVGWLFSPNSSTRREDGQTVYSFNVEEKINSFISKKYLVDQKLTLDKIKNNPEASEEIFFGYLDLMLTIYSSFPKDIDKNTRNIWKEAITEYIKNKSLTKDPITLVVDTVMAVETATNPRVVALMPTYDVYNFVTAMPGHLNLNQGIHSKNVKLTEGTNNNLKTLYKLRISDPGNRKINLNPSHIRVDNAGIVDPFKNIIGLINYPSYVLYSNINAYGYGFADYDNYVYPDAFLDILNFDKSQGINGFLLVQFSNLNLPQETTLGMLAYPKNQQSPFSKQLMAGKPVRIEFVLSNSSQEKDFINSLIENTPKLEAIQSIKLIASTKSERTVESNNADILKTFRKENLSEIKESDIYIKETNEKLLGEDNGADFKKLLKENLKKIYLNFTDKKINELLMGDIEKAKKATKDLKDHGKGKITLSAERLKEIDSILNPNIKVTYTFRDLKFKINYFDGKTEEIKVKGKVSDHVNYLTKTDIIIEDEPETASYTSMPVAYSEIKANEVNNETFEAMAGVPSTKKLFLASGGSEFMVHVEVERVEGEESVWREYEVKYDGCGPSEFRDGDKCPDKTFPSANGASSADTTAKMHTGGTYKAVWKGVIPNKAKAVKVDGKGKVEATCPAEPDRSAYDAAMVQAQAFVAAINAFSPTHTAASDGVTRTWNSWNASISTDNPVDPQTTNNSNT